MSASAEAVPPTASVAVGTHNPFTDAEPWEIRTGSPDFVLSAAPYRENARPRWVEPNKGEDDGDGVIALPEGLTPAAVALAKLLALQATARLIDGERTEYALTFAAGKHWLTDRLARMGIVYNPRTVARARDELADAGVLVRVGRMRDWTENGRPRTGANVYRLAVKVRTAGGWEDALTEAPGVPHTPNRTSTTARASAGIRAARIEGCLNHLVRLAYVGNRNHLGARLTAFCTDLGLTEPEVLEVMAEFRGRVPDPATYSMREVQATVASRFRRIRRGSEVPTVPAKEPPRFDPAAAHLILGPARTAGSARGRRHDAQNARRRVPEAGRILVSELTIETAPWASRERCASGDSIAFSLWECGRM